ncbi:MAG: hypothetical protein ABFR53_10660 [Actinomycetota bacterium]
MAANNLVEAHFRDVGIEEREVVLQMIDGQDPNEAVFITDAAHPAGDSKTISVRDSLR